MHCQSPHNVTWKWSESRSAVSNSFRPHGLYSPWNSLGQNTRVRSLSLLQGILPTQGSNPGLLHYRWSLYQLTHKEEKGTREDEMAGWHHQLNGHKFNQPLGVVDGQGSLACYSPWGHKESDTTERLNWLNNSTVSILGKLASCFQAL